MKMSVMTRLRLSLVGDLEAPRGGLDGIGQHDQGGLLALRPGTGVAVVLLADLLHLGVVFLLGLLVEVADEGVPVMLFDDVPDPGGELELPGDLHAFLDVVDDDQRAQRGGQVLVDVEVSRSGSR